MSDRERVKELLMARGCPDYVVEGGLEGLLDDWERTVKQVETGYALGLDDYLNDLDTRQLVEEALGVVEGRTSKPARTRLEALDKRMKTVTRRTDPCLWGSGVADEQGWTPTRNWWYFAIPRAPGPLLAADLEGLELE